MKKLLVLLLALSMVSLSACTTQKEPAPGENVTAEESASKPEEQPAPDAEPAAETKTNPKLTDDASGTETKTNPKLTDDASGAETKTDPKPADAASAANDPWKQIENSYYGASLPQSAIASAEDSDVLLGSHIIPGTITKQYTSENLNTKAGIAHFTQEVREHGLMQCLSDEGVYLATVEGPSDPVPGTVIFFNNKASQVLIGDEGKMYKFQVSDADKQAIDDVLDLEKTTACSIALDGFMDGILLNDGTNQMIKPLGFFRDILDTNTVYTVDGLLNALEEQTEALTYFEDLNKDLDPEKPDVVMG